ncbi:alpha-glucosidase [Gregarina niphandrodes]|uniref:Alpha-glucosidase n=1 Tax=Gregarina niphandrodes TaxID=110365 RepID=A0A023BBH9_GRENI|nr:alpha-glucosidase [Gregarina niphandrodes]EZG79921.1 alpha-glucosidase [Gregarina niphandrodes]|eukprot:XP_011134366.1 alpha-glucosidase [Gregarina niphandrodes]
MIFRGIFFVCLLARVTDGANRHQFDSCAKSSYCLPTAQSIGSWRWLKESSELVDKTTLKVNFRRSCLDSADECTSLACDCSAKEHDQDPPEKVGNTPVGVPLGDDSTPDEEEEAATLVAPVASSVAGGAAPRQLQSVSLASGSEPLVSDDGEVAEHGVPYSVQEADTEPSAQTEQSPQTDSFYQTSGLEFEVDDFVNGSNIESTYVNPRVTVTIRMVQPQNSDPSRNTGGSSGDSQIDSIGRGSLTSGCSLRYSMELIEGQQATYEPGPEVIRDEPCRNGRIELQSNGLYAFKQPAVDASDSGPDTADDVLAIFMTTHPSNAPGSTLDDVSPSDGPQLVLYHRNRPVAHCHGLVMDKNRYGFVVDYVDVLSQHGLSQHTLDFNLSVTSGSDPWVRFYNADLFEYELDSSMAMYGAIPHLVTVQPTANAVTSLVMLQPSELYVNLIQHDIHPGQQNYGADQTENQTATSSQTTSSQTTSSQTTSSQAIGKLSSRTAAFVGEYGRFDCLWSSVDSVTPNIQSRAEAMVTRLKTGLTGVARVLNEFTGFAPLLPTASFGLHQSRWNYVSQDDLLDVSQTYINYRLPLDYLWLDIDHSEDRQYFTWNEQFPDPEYMRLTLQQRKQNLVVIVDPHIKLNPRYSLYQKVKNAKVLIKESFGHEAKSSPDFNGWCWPGNSVYPDHIFKEDQLIDIYANYYSRWPELYRANPLKESNLPPLHGLPTNQRAGQCPEGWVSNNAEYCQFMRQLINVGVWNDMNEPSVFNKDQVTVPKHVLHQDGKIPHGMVHNLYGLAYHRVTYEALAKARPLERPFVLTRSAFVGSQKYGPMWTGDNTAGYGYLKNSISMILSMSLSGYSYLGADIGGFFGEPSDDLFRKWVELGIWYPFMRIHSTLGTTRRELYERPHILEHTRKALTLRYRLIPFWATTAYLHHRLGIPIWTSILDYQLAHSDQLTQSDRFDELSNFIDYDLSDDAFLVGETFFVYPDTAPEMAPNDSKNRRSSRPLPDTSVWYSLPSMTPVTGQVEHGNYIKSSTVLFTKERLRLSTEAQRFDPYTLSITLDRSTEHEFCGYQIFDDMKTVRVGTLLTVCVRPEPDSAEDACPKRFAVTFDQLVPASALYNTSLERVRLIFPKQETVVVVDSSSSSKNVTMTGQVVEWDVSRDLSVVQELKFSVVC